jgi:hypothetical protein
VELTLDHEAPCFSNMRRRSSRKDSDLTGVVDLRYTGGARLLLMLELGAWRRGGVAAWRAGQQRCSVAARAPRCARAARNTRLAPAPGQHHTHTHTCTPPPTHTHTHTPPPTHTHTRTHTAGARPQARAAGASRSPCSCPTWTCSARCGSSCAWRRCAPGSARCRSRLSGRRRSRCSSRRTTACG